MAVKFMLVVNINGNKKTIVNKSEEAHKKNLSICKDRGYEVIKKTKLYPVASWLKTQHVFYNAVDRAENALHDAFENGTEDELDKACEWVDRITELCGKFDCMPRDENQVVYMEYNDYKLARSVIEGYVWRHNDVICHGQRPMEVTDIIDC